MTRRRLPIGIQTFRELRERGCYYVDKTAYIRRLLDKGSHYFLSRPRRFGKSLFLDTLKELFEGNEPLFRGLHIHGGWDWSVRHPVLRLCFDRGNFKDPAQVEASLTEQLAAAERSIGICPQYSTVPERFRFLLEALHLQAGRTVAVLVDDYDKPILDVLDVPDVARSNRDFLLGVYSVIKDGGAHVRFSFLTGVSNISRGNLFSGLNHLNDITLDSRYSAVCGYTETDLDEVFAPELPELDRDEIRDWYGGYRWGSAEKVYNPFDILLLLRRRKFEAHGFETGATSFLAETLLRRRVSSPALEDMISTGSLMSTFDMNDIATEALLFQTGYLTITEEMNLGGRIFYRLGYANRKVKQGLNEHLLAALWPDRSRHRAHDIRLYELLTANDFVGLEALFRAFFADIPRERHTNYGGVRSEVDYASAVYSWFAASGLDTTVEDSSNPGRLDMTVRLNGNLYLFEFKGVELEPDHTAMAQLKKRRPADKYGGSSQPIWRVAVAFSQDARNLASFEAERA